MPTPPFRVSSFFHSAVSAFGLTLPLSLLGRADEVTIQSTKLDNWRGV
jgi:hypothetical protein